MSDHPPPEPTPFEKMAALASKVIAVPKSEVDKREAEWREEREKATEQKKREAPR
ncbi:MAG TPA: hypothetical protein VIM61_09760 [Chthoniobacterales bacterium]|jgi:hypothetical protein